MAWAGFASPPPLLPGEWPSLFCPPGHYAFGLDLHDGSQERCVECPLNTYSDGSDAWSLAACHACEPGFHTTGTGATACVPSDPDDERLLITRA
jgi:hypothetical protein